MDGRHFDDLARLAATSTSRRRVLKALLGGISGAVLGQVGPPSVSAETCSTTDLCSNGCCPPDKPNCCFFVLCVDLNSDPEHCGICGVICPTGATCDNRTCSCPADKPEVCFGTCVNPTSDPINCGSCGNACSDGDICSSGQCCPADKPTVCNGTCVDLFSDPNNCGVCGIVCPPRSTCHDRSCVFQAIHCPAGQIMDPVTGQCVCPSGTISCDGTCVDTGTDVHHCGGCGNICPTGQTCSSGQCVCTPDCAGKTCGDDGCGGSCGTCPTGESCRSNGQCSCPRTTCAAQGISCGTIPDGCGGTLDCGDCSGRSVCSNGQCVESCTPTSCADQGVSCGSISDGCGRTLHCGNCRDDQVCASNGQCVEACPDGTTLCRHDCVDTSSDAANCGDCGNRCRRGDQCVDGTCAQA